MARKKNNLSTAKPDELYSMSGDAQVHVTKGMPYSTAVLAIILAFVLGTITGTLLPQWMSPQGTANLQTPVAQVSNAQTQSGSSQPTAEEMRAIQELEKQLVNEPTNRQLFVKLGNACFDAHLHERAIQAYEKALELDPNDADVLTDVGIMYRAVGWHDIALERFRKAQAVDPKHFNSVFNEGIVLYHDMNKKAEGLACWQRLLDANPMAKAPDGKPLADFIKEMR